MSARGRWDDQRVDEIIGTLLRVGVFIATGFLLLGGALFLARHGGDHPDYRVFRGEPKDLRGVVGIAREALRPSGRGLIQFGLLALIATPVARVVFSVVAFAVQRDKLFIAVTMVVLITLLYSLFGPAL